MSNYGTKEIVPFASGNTRALWVISFLFILLFVNIGAIVSDYLQVNMVERIINGQIVTWAEATANDDRQAFIWGIQLLLSIIVLILLLIWVHRVYRNLQSLGADNLKFSPGWAVGGFFIPIWNLFHPFLVMRDIWKASDPSTDMNDRLAWKRAPLSFLVISWWLFLLVSWFIGIIANQWDIDTISLEGLHTFAWTILAIDVISLLYVILTIQLVRNINSRQTEKSNLALDSIASSPTIPTDESEELMWICDKCGAEVDRDDNFCPKCGDKF